MNKEILEVVKQKLVEQFPHLRPSSELYISPTFIIGGRTGIFEIQIYETGSRFEDPHGSVVTEIFGLGVGLITRPSINWRSRHGETLTKIYQNIFTSMTTIIDTLENEFLVNPDTGSKLLVRPLRIDVISMVQVAVQDPLTLSREIRFVGGTINARVTH